VLAPASGVRASVRGVNVIFNLISPSNDIRAAQTPRKVFANFRLYRVAATHYGVLQGFERVEGSAGAYSSRRLFLSASSRVIGSAGIQLWSVPSDVSPTLH